MTAMEKIVYLAAGIVFLLAWIPAISASRANQKGRLGYLALIIICLFFEVITGWGGYSYPRDVDPNIWKWPVGRASEIPVGYGLPICVVVLIWDAIANLLPRR